MQHILGQVRRCVEDYHMIEAGDKVAVGLLSHPLSGGGHHAGDRHAGHEL